MKQRLAKERIIYNNYDLDEMYEDCKQFLIDAGNEEPTEEEIWNEIYFTDSINWENEFEQLKDFFDNGTYIIFGSVGRWNGVYSGGEIFTDFEKAFYDAVKDCNYIKLYDENGHFYIHCSHHDGSCSYEIKKLTDKGIEYYNNWEYDWDDKRTEEYIHNKLIERYSTLPRYAEKVFGCKRTEYEPVTKENIINKLNNQARSFYC